MADITRSVAQTNATTIKDETTAEANTADRVGQMVLDIVESTVWNEKGTAAARPASGTYVGQTYFATDTGVQSRWDGSNWVTQGGGISEVLSRGNSVGSSQDIDHDGEIDLKRQTVTRVSSSATETILHGPSGDRFGVGDDGARTTGYSRVQEALTGVAHSDASATQIASLPLPGTGEHAGTCVFIGCTYNADFSIAKAEAFLVLFEILNGVANVRGTQSLGAAGAGATFAITESGANIIATSAADANSHSMGGFVGAQWFAKEFEDS